MPRKIKLPHEIFAGRIRLVRYPAELAYGMCLYRVLEKNRAHLETYFGGLNHKTGTLGDLMAQMRRDDAIFESGEGGQYYLVPPSFPEEPIGGVRVVIWPEKEAELMYWIDRTHQGQGFMTRAVQALEPVLFNAGVKHIACYCKTGNKASRRVLIHAGYKLRFPELYEAETRETDMEFVKRRPRNFKKIFAFLSPAARSLER